MKAEVYQFRQEMQPARRMPTVEDLEALVANRAIVDEPTPPDPRDPPVKYPPPTEEEWAQMEAVEVIRIIGQKYGYAKVGAWVKNLGFIAGETL